MRLDVRVWLEGETRCKGVGTRCGLGTRLGMGCGLGTRLNHTLVRVWFRMRWDETRVWLGDKTRVWLGLRMTLGVKVCLGERLGVRVWLGDETRCEGVAD